MTQADAPARPRAVIYIPATLSLDGHYAATCVTYATSRGYQLIAIIRDWLHIDRLLRSGRAGVVIVAREEHWTGTGTVEVAPVLDLDRHRALADTRSMERPGSGGDDNVRRVLEGCDPVPVGVAPETVAALRLIWWRLQDRS